MTLSHDFFPHELLVELRQVRSVAVITGAGISAESGVPTFRDAQTGLWAKYDPQELATPEAFRRHPRLVWEWYEWRRSLVSQAQPNPGHIALAKWEPSIADFTLITQNVDGLHQRAGSKRIVELHGNIYRTRCFEENRVIESWPPTDKVPPCCPHCGGFLRPDVVWFNEALPTGDWNRALSVSKEAKLFFSIGTSSLVYPAASLPMEALRAGATLVEINPEPTPLTPQATYSLRGPAGIFLPALLRAVESLA